MFACARPRRRFWWYVGIACLLVRRGGGFAAVQRRGSRPSSARRAANVAITEEDFFLSILEQHRIAHSVVLKRDAKGRRGLYASELVTEGQSLAKVQLSHVLAADASGAVRSSVAGQTDAMWGLAGDLREPASEERQLQGETWDVRLSLALVEVSGSKLYGQSAGLSPFWDSYSLLLPSPGELTLPVVTPERLLREARHSRLASDAKLQRARLRALYPTLMVTEEQERRREEAFAQAFQGLMETAPPFPLSALEWAFSVIRSRAFQLDENLFGLPPGRSTPSTSSQDFRGLPDLPFRASAKRAPCAPSAVLDMANHSPEPNANFRLADDKSFVELYALRDIPAGEEATISYLTYVPDVPFSAAQPPSLSLRRMMAQYGFVLDRAEGRESLDLRDLIDDDGDDAADAAADVELPMEVVRPAALSVLSEENTRITNDGLADPDDAAGQMKLLEDLDCRLQAIISELTSAGKDSAGKPEDPTDERLRDEMRKKARKWLNAVRRLDAELTSEVPEDLETSPVAVQSAIRLCETSLKLGPNAEESATLLELRNLVDPRLVEMVRYRRKRSRLVETAKQLLEKLID
eukprot:scaffold991_cov227-Pinguiococcus_pyrenoidosus.AAC.16